MRIDCLRARPLLIAFLDGELWEPERDAVREHLSGCDACGRAFSLVSGIRNAAVGAQPVRVPVGFADRVVARALAPARRPRFWRHALAPALALSGALVLFWYLDERGAISSRKDRPAFPAYERNILAPEGPLLPPSGSEKYRCQWHYCGGGL
ncbi:MAG: zf-HC2 domain-containing protein [Elusimicrobia bacterium]|nr:zf-HC2 domain-containing protein [Elusimicrobiota bacterium]